MTKENIEITNSFIKKISNLIGIKDDTAKYDDLSDKITATKSSNKLDLSDDRHRRMGYMML